MISAQLSLNNLSFGSVSLAILRELYRRNTEVCLFPIGNIDLSAQKPDDGFNRWLQTSLNHAQARHNRKESVIRLWHISGSLESLSSRGNNLITFQECGSLTPLEVHILKQQNKVFVTNNYAKSFFKTYGIDTIYVPLGFDSHNFHVLEKRPKIEGVTSFMLLGKGEIKRKWTFRQLGLWAKKYGNKKEYVLNCAITNPFLKPQDQNTLIANALEGKKYWNINFLPFFPTNAEYNSLLQSSDIVLGCTGCEGWDLPAFQATAMGAWPVALNAHAYTDYLNKDNAVLVSPNGMDEIYDNIFFHKGQPLNQGNVFTFSDEDFYKGCEEAEIKAKTGINKNGLKLQEMTYSKTLDILLENL